MIDLLQTFDSTFLIFYAYTWRAREVKKWHISLENFVIVAPFNKVGLLNIKGMAIGVSKEKYANETFRSLREKGKAAIKSF